MDLAQQKMSEFANTLFEKLVFASKDSTDLNDTIDQYVQLFTDPEVKFGQLTQHCCQFVEAKLALLSNEEAAKYPVKPAMIPLRMMQILKNQLNKRKQYNEEYITEHLPGFLESYTTQQANKEKKRKRTEQQQQQQQQQQQTGEAAAATLSDELNDAFAAADFAEESWGETSGSPIEEKSAAESLPEVSAASKKKRKAGSASAASSDEPSSSFVSAKKCKMSCSPEEQEKMISSMETLLQIPEPVDFLSMAPVPSYETTNSSSSRFSNFVPTESIMSMIDDPALAIEGCVFLLYNSVFREYRHIEDVVIVYNLIAQWLNGLKKFFGELKK